MGWQFSYCFAPPDNQNSSGYGGEFIFGRDAKLHGDYTPMIANRNEFGSVYYYLTLIGISVGDEQLLIPPGTFDQKSDGTGGVIIDSGVKLTILHYSALDLLTKSLKNAITLEHVADGSDMAALCYKGSKKNLEADTDVPNLTFHFSNLDIVLHPMNYFDEEASGVICLTMVPKRDLSIFGIMAQQNKNIGYDLENQRLYVSHVDC
ncbi:aspartic proteinase nepenthesin-1-like protein [Carex littledalei]|uniref:Aspartic proteinase nepenthesin-1-like protein n=1 Tax=Carex littledalei TaxID=544730 RepID=A0A833QKN8_9POAL|nr:aspartic proteinase nepenthesin-1-like protein [Carex littledalei]